MDDLSSINTLKHIVNIGGISIGGSCPIVVQSMTDTDTSDVNATTKQVIDLHKTGAEIVRITVNNVAAAKAIPFIKDKLHSLGYGHIPLVGCFHYNAHQLLTNIQECAEYLDKYRINPGNVGFGERHDENFETIIKIAIKYDKPIRIGVNWGSIDQELLTLMMDANAISKTPLSAKMVLREALIQSTLISAKKAEEIGLSQNKIVISAKTSTVQDLIAVYEELDARSCYAIHLGLTEAGSNDYGVVSSAMAIGILLQRNIGNTIRVSITPLPGESRCKEVMICRDILQALDIRSFRPVVTSCPGCGRTNRDCYRKLACDVQNFLDMMLPEWSKKYLGVEYLKIAVMGCVVNGPGESKHADIGISLPGKTEDPIALVYIDGHKTCTLHGEDIANQFNDIIAKYVKNRFSDKAN